MIMQRNPPATPPALVDIDSPWGSNLLLLLAMGALLPWEFPKLLLLSYGLHAATRAGVKIERETYYVSYYGRERNLLALPTLDMYLPLSNI